MYLQEHSSFTLSLTTCFFLQTYHFPPPNETSFWSMSRMNIALKKKLFLWLCLCECVCFLNGLSSLRIHCELEMSLLCWGSGELGQTGHGRPGDVGPEKACLTQFNEGCLGTVTLLACGSSHSIAITGTTLNFNLFSWQRLSVFNCKLIGNLIAFWLVVGLLDVLLWSKLPVIIQTDLVRKYLLIFLTQPCWYAFSLR